MKNKIVIDVDDVILGTHEFAEECVNAQYPGIKFNSGEDLKSWDMEELTDYPYEGGVRNLKEVIYGYFDSTFFMNIVPLKPGAIQALTELSIYANKRGLEILLYSGVGYNRYLSHERGLYMGKIQHVIESLSNTYGIINFEAAPPYKYDGQNMGEALVIIDDYLTALNKAEAPYLIGVAGSHNADVVNEFLEPVVGKAKILVNSLTDAVKYIKSKDFNS